MLIQEEVFITSTQVDISEVYQWALIQLNS